MLSRFQSSLTHLLKHHLPSALRALPGLNPTEQTRASWARRLVSYDEVPPAFREFFAPLQAAGRDFPYTVLAPTYQGFLHRQPEKLACDLENEIAVLEKSGGGFQATHYPLEGIARLEMRSVLLDAWIVISGLTRQGASAAATLRFNSVTDYLFAHLLETVRSSWMARQGETPPAEQETFDDWMEQSFKFMNYARRSLLTGERLLGRLLQLEIRLPRLRTLGWTLYRSRCPTHAVLLTPSELILIREEPRRRGDPRYGGVWNYLPVHNIQTLELAEGDAGLLELEMELPGGERLTALFQPARRPEVASLVERFQELKSGQPALAFA